jgi:hypothetical protein
MTSATRDEIDVHSIVRQAWADGLGHEDFTDDDHYFSIGGTSMSALKVMKAIGGAVGRKLSVRMIFDNQTVGGLQDVVRAALAGDQP